MGNNYDICKSIHYPSLINTQFFLFMNILLIGGGGREHALAWKLSQSPQFSQLFIAPGNPGTAQLGINVAIGVNEFEQLGNLCIEKNIELVLVGPEDPLVNGLYDFFLANERLRQIAFIGPSKYGAQLEGSKAFAKAFMHRHHIPTAAYKEFSVDTFAEGVTYIKQHSLPIVLKADGLAAGKGVLILNNHDEAVAEYEAMLKQSKFGEAGNKIVIEEFLDGIEMSVFVLTDGKDFVVLPSAKDYKRIGEQDTGLNTGGMGAISPVPFATPLFMDKVMERIIKPTINGLYAEKVEYTGFVFIGLIAVKGEPYVIEYNCRMGDPETEVVMPRLKNDLVELCLAASSNQLHTISINEDDRCAATVVAVSGGYPQQFIKGYAIQGLDQLSTQDSILFHAGTAYKENDIVTNGGRVLCVTSYGENIEAAVKKSLLLLETINYENMFYRKDIGYEFD